MDAAKLETLQQLGYRVLSTCGRCKFATFKGYEWGTCSKHTYEHKKHTGPARQLSIHRSGCCDPEHFEPKETEDLHGFRQLEA